MHPTTKHHIIGMLGMIRTACSSIEAALSQETARQLKVDAKGKPPAVDEDFYLTEEQEEKLGQLIGITPMTEPSHDFEKGE